MRKFRWTAVWVVGVAALGAGCSKQKPPPTAAQLKPISNDEALEFGEELADSLVELDVKAVREALDMEALIEASTEGVAAPYRFRQGFLKGVRQSLEAQGPPLLVEMRPSLEAGADLKATKAVSWQGRPTVVMRLIEPEGAAAYILFVLDRRPDGRIRAVDYFPLASGELGSQTIRHLYLVAAAEANQGLLAKLMGKEQNFIKHADDIQRMAAANREGRWQEVLSLYGALPEDLKGEKVFLIQRYRAAQRSGSDATYLEAIQDFARRLPGDPACDFLLLDGYVLQNQPEKSLECFDRLDALLGGDAYLKALRGGVLTLAGREDEAGKALHEALADEPDLRPALNGLLNLALKQKRFAEVVEMLDRLETQFDQAVGGLSQVEEFEEFLDSPEGKAWAEKQKSKKLPAGEEPEAVEAAPQP